MKEKKFPAELTDKVAPDEALCGFCMNAVYAMYWRQTKAVNSCNQYQEKPNKVCEAIAKDVEGKKKDIGKALRNLYEMYGPQFSGSLLVCQDGGCCAGNQAADHFSG